MKSEPTCDVAIREEDHDRLMAHLYPGDGDEYGAVLRAGIVSCDAGASSAGQCRGASAGWGTDYVPGKYGYRALAPTFIHRQIVRCRDERMAYLAVHNHGSDRSVHFSKVDMDSHERGLSGIARYREGACRSARWSSGGARWLRTFGCRTVRAGHSGRTELWDQP